MTKTAVTLDDKYLQSSGRVFISSNQALVRLLIEQARRDRATGLKTAGYVSGYRGSPLGVLDAALWAAQPHLDKHDIKFSPGLNEELAASGIRGTQELGWFGKSTFDGVFGLWYGKGIGVDRACEALKLGNFEGASATGGFLAVAGDDHGGKSSDSAHQSEQTLMAAMLPTLYPATIGEIIELGLFGWAMSRYSGAYVGLKCVTDTLDLTAAVNLPDALRPFSSPTDFEMPAGGLNLRPNLPPLVEEDLLVNKRLPAATAFARANGVDKVIFDGARRELAIVSAGKAHLDVRQALVDLGLTETECSRLGIRLYKPSLIWPMDREALTRFAQGSRAVLVVEEKRPVMEDQVARHLYALPADRRPALLGKLDLKGAPLLPSTGELSAPIVRRALLTALTQLGLHDLAERQAHFADLESRAASFGAGRVRPAYFCSGCPHNTSTKIPDGSIAMGGIGCHGLVAVVMDRNTMQFMPMGHEGSNWAAVSKFVETPHVFANMGDGTYSHSGLLSIRAAVAAHANITYKLLFNDAVAMTGGQPVEQQITPVDMVYQLLSEGVRPVRLVSDNPAQYAAINLPPHTSLHHRDEMDRLQRELREQPGVSAIVYEQTCAAEKRRRRKRGRAPDPDQRVFINQDVCEGCGDCSVQANCISIVPIETEFGRKRKIDQSTCNKDYSCLKGFCPSFVTVTGAKIATQTGSGANVLAALQAQLPTPALVPASERPYNILVAGIGGTGVLTLGAILGMAAHIEGKASTILDMTGMAQKGGAVTSHIRIGATPDAIHSSRLSEGMTDLLVGCDLVVSSSNAVLRTVRPGHTAAVANSDVAPTGEFQTNRNADLSGDAMRDALESALAGGRLFDLRASTLATEIIGDSIGANILMLGYAAQAGLLPVGVAAIEEAIRLNGAFVKGNLQTFTAGRIAAHAPRALAEALGPEPVQARLDSIDEVLASRTALLRAYQDEAYAQRYADTIRSIRQQTEAVDPAGQFAREAALTLARLMAYKDEYEVARLYTTPQFMDRVRGQFSGEYRLSFHLAPPFLPGRDESGRPKKRVFPGATLSLFKVLTAMKGLRGTVFDIFGYTAERKAERALVADYERLIAEVASGLTPENIAPAVELARAASEIRGFGPVKETAIAAYRERLPQLLAAYRKAATSPLAA